MHLICNSYYLICSNKPDNINLWTAKRVYIFVSTNFSLRYGTHVLPLLLACIHCMDFDHLLKCAHVSRIKFIFWCIQTVGARSLRHPDHEWRHPRICAARIVERSAEPLAPWVRVQQSGHCVHATHLCYLPWPYLLRSVCRNHTKKKKNMWMVNKQQILNIT